MNVRITALLAAVLILLVMFYLLRRRQLREKYAVLWIFLGACAIVVALAPDLLVQTSELLGFGLPVNFFFCLVGAILLFISMQFSLELGRLGERSRRLAEQVAFNELEISELRARIENLESSRDPEHTDAN